MAYLSANFLEPPRREVPSRRGRYRSSSTPGGTIGTLPGVTSEISAGAPYSSINSAARCGEGTLRAYTFIFSSSSWSSNTVSSPTTFSVVRMAYLPASPTAPSSSRGSFSRIAQPAASKLCAAASLSVMWCLLDFLDLACAHSPRLPGPEKAGPVAALDCPSAYHSWTDTGHVATGLNLGHHLKVELLRTPCLQTSENSPSTHSGE